MPHARPSGISYDRYTDLFRTRLGRAGYRVDEIHEAGDPAHAVRTAESIFIGGGNTFVLLRAMYETGILETIRARVAEGLPYMGSSAGSTHMGESRETRINEFHVFNPEPVIGLREGAWLLMDDTSVKLQGTNGARVFRRQRQPEEVEARTCLDSLLQE